MSMIPVPDKLIVCVLGLIFRLVSVKMSEPLIAPTIVGVKLMGSVQLVWAGNDPDALLLLPTSGQELLPLLLSVKLVEEILGSFPEEGIGKLRAVLPMFSTVTVCGLSLLVLPTAVVGTKVNEGGVLTTISFTALLPLSPT